MKLGERVPEELARARLMDRTGTAFDFRTLYAEHPAVIVFLRHFGCYGCSEQVAELIPRLAELAELGFATALIGNGEPEHIGPFALRHGLDDKSVRVLTDPSLESFRRAGLDRSFWKTFGPVAARDAVRALLAGHTRPGTEGDLYQQGGALVVDELGTLRFYHRNPSLGGHASTVELVDAALRVLVARSSVCV
jgi:peroxiredoxin